MEEHQSLRYGLLEPPVVLDAGILTEESNFRFMESFLKEPILRHASKYLGYVSRTLKSGNYSNSSYPVEYFINWAKEKGIKPCWLHLVDSEWAEDWISRLQWSKEEAIALLKGFNPEKLNSTKNIDLMN